MLIHKVGHVFIRAVRVDGTNLQTPSGLQSNIDLSNAVEENTVRDNKGKQ